MASQFIKLQEETTKALIKFILDHNGSLDKDLLACLHEIERGNIEAAVKHARMVKPHGMGGITDWFPPVVTPSETESYNDQVLRSLVNEWCRVISLSFEERDMVSRSAQKGELAAQMTPNGWVLCPFCQKTFSSNSDSWVSGRHRTCGVRLKLVPVEEWS